MSMRMVFFRMESEGKMSEKKRKPIVIWVTQDTSGRLTGLIHWFRWQAARNGKPIKFVEAK